MRKEGLLRGLGERGSAFGEQVGRERRREMGLRVVDVGGDELAVACALAVGAPTVDLEIGIRVLAVQDGAGAIRTLWLCVGVDGGAFGGRCHLGGPGLGVG